MAKRSRGVSNGSRNWWTIAGVTAAAIALVAVGYGGVVAATREDVTVTASTYTPAVPTAAQAVTRPTFDLATVGAALAGPDPYTITVAGDSTGNEPTEWVYLLAGKIDRAYGRPVTIHDWSLEANDYRGETTIGNGPGAPVTIWNGSASGMNTEYSLKNINKIAPQPSNLFVVSHGHNHADPNSLVSGDAKIVSFANKNVVPGGGTAVILQNPRADDRKDGQAANIDALKKYFAEGNNTGVALIDVYTPFGEGDVISRLRPDKFHPNDAGEQLWASVVASATAIPN